MRRIEFKPKGDARYRTIPEAAIIEQLLLVSWAVEVDGGERDAAQAAASEALEGWIGAGLGYRLGADGSRLFDPAEVVNFLKWAGITGQDRYWEDHFVKTHRAFVSEFQPAVAEHSAPTHLPTRFRMALRRTFDLQPFAEAAGVRLRSPLLLAGEHLHDLEVAPVLDADFQGETILREHCLEVRLKAPLPQQLTIGADFSFIATAATGQADATPLTPRELDLYSRKSEGLIQVTPRIEALAHELGGVCDGDVDAVEAFWSYMLDTLLSGMVRYGEVPADAPCDWVLDHGWYDCQLGAALLVALCRARGVPARLVNGYCLYRVQPISHYWAEVWIDGTGWRPYDVMCWDLSLGGRDPSWRNLFAGKADYRAPTQCFPLAFTGPMSVRFPADWHMIQAAGVGGIVTTYIDVEDSALIYRDHVAVKNLGKAR